MIGSLMNINKVINDVKSMLVWIQDMAFNHPQNKSKGLPRMFYLDPSR